MHYRQKLAILIGLALFTGSCGMEKPSDDSLLSTHLGSLDKSKATRIEIDFFSAREWNAWFYVEAPIPVISDTLRTEGFYEGCSDPSGVLTNIASSPKMPPLPPEEDCKFYTFTSNTRGVFYNAVTNRASDKLWIVAMRY